MKTSFAILCSVVLLWTQVVFAVNPLHGDTKTVAHCACCGDKAMACCPAPASGGSQSAPLTSTRPSMSVTVQAAKTCFQNAEAEPSSSPVLTVSFDLSRPHWADVPIFQRNCSYLI
ncbi:MAG: hypothetical protein H7X97_01820 [Opitutaceae bacterium]|nr:hypothetical protein [Verrucomicrobiales bacterium]